MIFDWDPAKAAYNLHVHKVDFNDARCVFRDPNRVEFIDKGNYSSDEVRYNTIGLVNQLLFVVYTERVNKNGEEVTRIISARKATKKEASAYVCNL